MLNVSAKCLHFRFEFAEGQNTKIHAKYQNSFQAQNAKISAVSTPILTAKAAFCSIFRALSENQWKTNENPENVKNLRTKIRKIWKRVNIFDVFWYFSAFWKFGILLLVVFCIFVLKY